MRFACVCICVCGGGGRVIPAQLPPEVEYHMQALQASVVSAARDIFSAAYTIMFPALDDAYVWKWLLLRNPLPSR